MKSKAKPATKAEREHLAAVKSLPCVACSHLGIAGPYVCGPTEAHHLLSGNKRRGHMFVLPLGSWHHRAVLQGSLTFVGMRALYGPSLAHGSKPFHAAFGSDDELLARVNELLAQRRAA